MRATYVPAVTVGKWNCPSPVERCRAPGGPGEQEHRHEDGDHAGDAECRDEPRLPAPHPDGVGEGGMSVRGPGFGGGVDRRGSRWARVGDGGGGGGPGGRGGRGGGGAGG